MKLFQPRTLHKRIMLAIALLQLVVVGLFAIYLLIQQVGNEITSRQVLGHKMIGITAPAVSHLIRHDPAGISGYLGAMLGDRAVAGITVKDRDGKTLFLQRKESGDLHPVAGWFKAAEPHPKISAELRSEHGSLGLMTIELSNDLLNEKIRGLLNDVSYLFMLLLGVDLIAIQLLVKSVMAPLTPLAAMAREVSQGNWEKTVLTTEDGASDEVRNLSDAFIESAKTMKRQIRELEKTRAQLAENELKLRNLVDNMQEVLLEVDQNGLVTFLNPAWEALTGYAAETTLHRPFAEFLTQPRHKAYFEAGRLEHIPLTELQLELRAHDGRPVWMQMSTSLQRDDTGAVSGLISTLEDITETLHLQELQHQHEQDLYRLTITDPLTGVYNRRHFDELLENLLHMNLHKGHPLALVIVDIDGFKFINDTYGHPVGDEVLRTVATSLRNNKHQGGAVARIAGDEFALLLQNVNEMDAERIGHMIHEDLNRIVIPLPVGQLTVQTSIGIAIAPVHGKLPQDLVRAADVALYHAKKSGRNRVDTLTRERGEAIMDIFSQGFEVRNAIIAGLILPFMQPIVDLKTRKIFAYEVLTRMRRGDAFVPADDFIPIAEDLGLIREMDLFVIGQALKMIPKNVHLFVNISLSSFYAPEFAQQLRDLLNSPVARGRSITLEFTERETVEMSREFIQLFDEIRAGSCNVALDDFGVGYSTYSYLRVLRPEFVKIDGSFVLKLKENQEDVKIVEQIRELAHIIGAHTIAEHIEDEETIAMLVKMGVDYGQGYFFSKPVNVDDKHWLTADLA
ncbi:MAG: EAL domain-containing protein [Sulfuricella denitrificans]|nr:EAL domain-containing protein [Sulfuricella denitrificans]